MSANAGNGPSVTLGGELTVAQLGYGAMQLTGKGIWGPPADPQECLRVLRRAVELGVTFIDTADSYGPYVSEELIAEALHPYPDDLVLATKGGLLRTGPNVWSPCGRPDYLRQEVELSLRRLKLERIDLYQLHRIDPQVPVEDSLGELVTMRDEGKIRLIGVSEVDVAELEQCRRIAPVVSVQNRYNLAFRGHEDVLDYCEAAGIAFIPWAPMASGGLAKPGGALDSASKRHGVSAAQLALAWVLRRSPVMLPIPGTSTVAHLEENMKAAAVELSDAEFGDLEQAA
ncbi:MAG TPA: aldo/keto reductase [Frankiaceae bacterium]|jgi:aryl-alcohol dehydrogenase-like predicted oxidoreductase|nr:aldo/keto reductase [Frankiaceae bacterium]